ncbi:MAG: hypothetical protein LBE39_17115 [Flavobacteriaceae bacterium]|nr:hypothetical protein [Flavobacteriaceae bacterium]
MHFNKTLSDQGIIKMYKSRLMKIITEVLF